MLKKLRRILTFLMALVLLFSQICVFGEGKTLDEIKKSLSFSVLTSQSITEIKENFNLPVVYEGAFILWESDNENALCIDGGSTALTARVIRPPFGEGYVSVTLTAYITLNGEMTEKSFLLRIKEQDIGFKYSNSITQAYQLFEMEFLVKQNLLAVKSDLILPKTDAYDRVTLTYKSDNTTVLSDEGKVNRNYEEDTVVTLTVFFTEGFETFKVSYPLTVKAYTDDEIRAIAQKDLDGVVTKLKNDYNLFAVNKNLDLPNKGAGGSLIEWTTSNSDVIASNGVINTAAVGNSATLTATAIYRGATVASTLDVKIAMAVSSASEIEGNKGLGNVTYNGGGGTGISKDDKEEGENPPSPSVSFSDVSETHWAFDAIEEMKAQEILGGTGNGKFAPEAPVTREQALKLIVNTLNVECESNYQPFTDVSENEWYAPFIKTCYAAGIVKGINKEWFGVGVEISRQDFCVILLNAMEYCSKILPEEVGSTFSDNGDIALYAQRAVNTLSSAGIIGGMPDGSFKPLKNMTRAEAAVVLYRVLQKWNYRKIV